MDSDRLAALRAKRVDVIEKEERRKLRSQFGARLAGIIAETTGSKLTLSDFDIAVRPKFTFIWPKDLRSAPGLSLVYVDKDRAAETLACFQTKVDAVSGLIGFHDKAYMGLAKVDNVRWASLLASAEAAKDSIVLYEMGGLGAVLVDYYPSTPSGAYSVVVQGEALVTRLTGCFGHPPTS
jgi:hypothetical protein